MHLAKDPLVTDKCGLAQQNIEIYGDRGEISEAMDY